ncbi:prolipoprotein diacylglyceryl transferase [Candidatus Uhrbacteria bacterium]|nr:prolipoprotein diacylglyceryl transferase [Candidatus Uhrbacteria bacterium]
MLPYFHLFTIHLGPIPIQVWGLFVALGILTGAYVSAWMTKKRGQDPKIIFDLAFWVIIGAMIFARLFHIIYEPTLYFDSPLQLVRIWDGGMSVMGGFIGSVLFGVLFLRKQKVDIWSYADTAIFGLPIGLFVGRIGCFLLHEHPGNFTNFFLGVKYPDGVRHDLGLYLSLNGLILAILFFILARINSKVGTYIVVFLIWKGIARFFLDFLRATDLPMSDVRYFGLTPAQYIAIVMMMLGFWFWYIKLSKKN